MKRRVKKDEPKGEARLSFKRLLMDWLRLAHIAWSHQRLIVIAYITTVLLISVYGFAAAAGRALLIDALIASAAAGAVLHRLVMVLVLYACIELIGRAIDQFNTYADAVLWQRWSTALEVAFVEKQAELDVAMHESPAYQNLKQRVQEQSLGRAMPFLMRFAWIAGDLIGVSVAFAVLLSVQWHLAVLLLIATVPDLLSSFRRGSTVYNIWSSKAEQRRRFSDLRWHFFDTERFIELRLFQNLGHFVGIIRGILGDFLRAQDAIERRYLLERMIAGVISEGASVYAGIMFALRTVSGDITIGALTFLLSAMGQLNRALVGLVRNLGKQYGDGLFVRDLIAMLDARPVISAPSRGVVLGEGTPDIRFENVTFTYPETARPALKNFSLAIPPGTRLALVGANGAGKTTLIKLLCRFYDPQEGRILVDGQDLRTVDLESWYRLIGALMQDYAKYNFIVIDAIAAGRTSDTPDIQKVKSAAKAAEADVFIEEWEKSYGQQLGREFSGVEPSIGQWQKLALARMFYRDPRVLVLDEPTSSIDAESEARIFERIEALPHDRTAIMISHRFSTVKSADMIVVISGGRIKEQGTHAELMEKGGTYARLFRLQAKRYGE